MSSGGNTHVQSRHNLDKIPNYRVTLAADTTLTLAQAIAKVDSTSAAITITLPSVAAAAGSSFFIIAPVGATNSVTVEDLNDDAGLTDIVLDANAEHVMLWSSGEAWFELITGYA